MEAVTAWVASVTAALSIVVAIVVVVAWRSSMRRTAAELAELREALARVVPASAPAAVTAPMTASVKEPMVAEFLITDAGSEHREVEDEVSTRLVLSATVGEPLVKLAAFAYGVRRALSPENRNRIRFEMKREVRRARKARRAAGRDAVRAAAREARARLGEPV